MKHWIIFVMIFTFSTLSYAQKEDLDAMQKGFSNTTQSGKIFQVQLQPTSKELHLFITGLDSGKVKWDDTTVEASFGMGKNKKVLIAEKVKDPETGKPYYRLRNLENSPENLNLNIRSGGSIESFSFPRQQ